MKLNKLNYDPEATILERLLDNEKLLGTMLEMPQHLNEQMVQSRRTKLFSMFWENTSMSREQVLKNIQESEELAISKYSNQDIPDWLIRMEAQDVQLKLIHDEFEEEGLID